MRTRLVCPDYRVFPTARSGVTRGSWARASAITSCKTGDEGVDRQQASSATRQRNHPRDNVTRAHLRPMYAETRVRHHITDAFRGGFELVPLLRLGSLNATLRPPLVSHSFTPIYIFFFFLRVLLQEQSRICVIETDDPEPETNQQPSFQLISPPST